MGRHKKVLVSTNPATGTVVKKVVSESQELDTVIPGANESAEKAEFEAAKAEFEKVDGITAFIRSHFDAPEARHVEDYTDARLPWLKDKSLLKVKRFYPMVKAIVDAFPAGTSIEDIHAKKWEFQRLGYKYAWICEGEDLSETAEEFIKRFDPLTEQPEKRLIFNTSIADGARI